MTENTDIPEVSECVVSLGSNLGDRGEYIRKAIEMLSNDARIYSMKCASLYETEPVGYENQPNFLNTCVVFDTDYEPLELLDLLQSIENKLHRVRNIRFGPRTVDLDLLLFGTRIIDSERLIVPHPRMYERAFVLVPLKELSMYDGAIPDGKMVNRVGFVFPD